MSEGRAVMSTLLAVGVSGFQLLMHGFIACGLCNQDFLEPCFDLTLDAYTGQIHFSGGLVYILQL